MAYNSRQGRYQEAQYQPRPQQQTGRYNEYNSNPYSNPDVRLQQQYSQEYDQYQQAAYDHNQQYSQGYGQAHDQSYDRYEGSHPYHEQEVTGYNSVQPPSQQTRQPRQYQYDDRFRTNGRDVPQQGDRRNNTATGRRSVESSRPGTSASSHQKPKQERILAPPKLESPKAMAWDSPFGVFPGTKKDLENKKKEADESRSRSRAETPADRPATSSSSRATPADQTSTTRANRSFEQQRPHTSHASQGRQPQSPQRNFNTFNQPLGSSDGMPLRKKPPPPQQKQEKNEMWQQQTPNASKSTTYLGLPARPAPHRSTSGPLPDTQPISPDPRSMSTQPHASSQQNSPNYLDEQTQDPYRGNQSNEYNESPGYNAGRPQYGIPALKGAVENQSHTINKHSMPKNYGELGYRGVDPSRIGTAIEEPGMPNFAAMAPDATEHVERELTLQSKPVAYRKPTYGDASSKPPHLQTQMPPQSNGADDFVQSPYQNFDFALQAQDRQQDPNYRGRGEGRGQQELQHGQYDRGNQQQYSDRNGNQAGFSAQASGHDSDHPYNQSGPRKRQDQFHMPGPPGHNHTNPAYDQRHRAPRQDYGFDDQGYPKDHQYDNAYNQVYDYDHQNVGEAYQQPLTRTRTEPVNNDGYDHYNHGYDQRNPNQPQVHALSYDRNEQHQPPVQPVQYQSNQDFDQFGHATPARPRTANSSRTPVRQYPDHPMPGSRPPNSAFPVADRNHPVPIRPGLMEPIPNPTATPMPVPSVQTSPPRAVQTSAPNTRQQPVSTPKTPVTIQELNDLRARFRDRPNDDKLGLHFVKKLVEAASVLASEGGRADPKTTAKNRERYVNDAYRIVKKLVANNSVEATFYLADCYGSGQLGLEVNPKEAFQLYTSAAKAGHAQSAYRVAVCCELGPDGGGGTRRDHVKATQFYKRAATLGDGPAMFKMGMILLKGLLGQQANRREGISWLKRAAERADEDNPHALHELALLYETAQPNDVLVRDERYALQLFTQAANLGYKYSQYRLGSAFEYGTLGVLIDPRQSIYWYTQAAKKGEHQSEFALSGWYLTGSEPLLSQSDAEAYLWARKAAQNGLAKAEYAMGYYTEVGIGVEPNIEEAKKWYFRAAAQMDGRARERLEEIKRGGARKEKTRFSRSNVSRQNEGECAVM